MNGKTLVQIESPKTQSIDGVKALLSWKGRSSNPLPQFVELGKEESRMVLVLSNKKDAYYCVTSRACSCPANTWHPGHQCKHQRRYFPQEAAKTVSAANDSIKPVAKWAMGAMGLGSMIRWWPKGYFRPVGTRISCGTLFLPLKFYDIFHEAYKNVIEQF